jgi:ABC-type transport system involved in multi-copper enzyme maturation permease subunit
VTRLPVLTGLALRELWITFRLIPILVLPVLAGFVEAVVPPELAGLSAVGGAGFWFATSLAAAVSIIAAIAAWSLATERHGGTAAWMVVRAVPRSTVLVSWFVALAILLAIGIGLGGMGAWLTVLERAETTPDAIPFMAAVAASLATAWAAVALGLLVGTLFGRRSAAVVALLACGLVLGLAVAGPLATPPLPTAGLGVLASLDQAARPVSDAFRAAGGALAAAAALLVVAAALMERTDL